MKSIFNFIFLFYCNLYLYAQNNTSESCYFDYYINQNSSYIKESNKKISQYLSDTKKINAQSSNVKIIPLVVHVIHENGAENISDSQIVSQINVLNEDFRRMLGTNGYGNGVDTEIEFCLAKITPDGKCTDGIVRIESELTDHQTYQRSALNDLSFWDNTRYLNLYVVKDIGNGSGTLGYASYPGGPAAEDGIVILSSAFGNIGTVNSPYHLGRTLTHEVGHWLGLYHTFNNSCGIDTCLDGDYVCDTPPVSNPNYSCQVINTCNNDLPDINDQIENYMDYTDDACKNIFSAGQKLRMDATLNTYRLNIWQDSNTVSTGCDSNYITSICNVVADFTSDAQEVCVNSPIQFTNKSLNTPLSHLWYFPGGTPSSSTDNNPSVIYDSIGKYPVTLVAVNSIGTDSLTLTDYISVSNPSTGDTIPYSENFESLSFPSNGISIENTDNGITWELDTTAVQYEGIASVKINNLINTNYGQSDAIILPVFDLTLFSGTPYLTFKWAYAKSDDNYSDELIVLISTDCGVNWKQIFYRSGSNLATGTTQITEYIPDSNTTWKSATISLNSYSSSDHAFIKIVNVTDGGNNLYIDNINVGSLTSSIQEPLFTENAIRISPNPANTYTRIEYDIKLPTHNQIQLTDMAGKTVAFYDSHSNSESQILINTSKIPSGFYFIQIFTTNQKVTQKLIINH